MLWQLRAPTEDDVAFLFNSILKSHRQSPVNADLANDIYYSNMHSAIDQTIRNENTRIVVACDPREGESGVIFGYGVAESFGSVLCIHFIYIKHSFRNFGMGRDIEKELLKIPHSTVSYSCQTKLTKLLNRVRNYTYNPFYLWRRVK